MKLYSWLLVLLLSLVYLVSCQLTVRRELWIPLFNGQNLNGWDIKIRGHELNDNYANTFRVEDGLLVVSYDEYEEFGDRFGHIFYQKAFSHYKLRVEYRFVGDQVTGGAGWAFRNNGVMFHSQPAAELELNQNFPISIEAQMLGGDGVNERPTGSVCTPGTTIEINGVRRLEHCIASNSKTYHGDEWVTMELVVLGDSIVHHIVEGDTVMTYGRIQLEADGSPLKKGHIALQAESHRTEFRKIEIMLLK
jgi:hypothetical protein